MLKVIQAPEPIGVIRESSVKLFLAGGISGCQNWQSKMIDILQKTPTSDMVIFNPRRDGDLAQEGDEASRQIAWEQAAMCRSNVISFWFPKETLCPITLFELGYAVGLKKKMAVGIEPGYLREFDIRVQLPGLGVRLPPVSTLSDLVRFTLFVTQ